MLELGSGEIQRTVTFESASARDPEKDPFMRRVAVDVDGDGALEFLTPARSWVGRTSLHDAEGKVVWVHPEESGPGAPAIESTHFADLDGDGKIEILLTFNATSEVHLLDHEGELVWAQDWGRKPSGRNICFMDVTGDGELEIVYVDGKALMARDAEGDVVASTELPGGGFVNHLARLHAFGEPPTEKLLLGAFIQGGEHRGQEFRVVSADARAVGERVAWDEVELHRAAEPVAFPGSPRMYAHIETTKNPLPMEGFDNRVLRFRLTNAARQLVHEDVLISSGGEAARSDGALLFVEEAADREARILVAYGDTLWAYTLTR